MVEIFCTHVHAYTVHLVRCSCMNGYVNRVMNCYVFCTHHQPRNTLNFNLLC